MGNSDWDRGNELDNLRDLHDQFDRDDAARETDSDRSDVDVAWDDAASEGCDG